MGVSFYSLLLIALVALTIASPRGLTGDIAESRTGLVAHRRGTDNIDHLRKREETSFDLNRSWDNEVIFDGNSRALDATLSNAGVQIPRVRVTCVKCCTSGIITASLNDDGILDPTFRIDLRDAAAFVELGVVAAGAATFSIPLLPSPADLVSSVVRGVDVNLGFSINLVFDVTAELDVQGGFAVDFPDDAFLEVSLLNGVTGDLSFDGIRTQSLPLSVNLNGSQTLKASLQLQTAAGFTVSDNLPLIDISGGASVGAVINLVEFVAELDSTPECQVQSSQSVNLNVGVFGGAQVDVGGLEAGAVPTLATTLLAADLGVQCIVPTGVPLIPRPAPIATTPACQVAPQPTLAPSSPHGLWNATSPRASYHTPTVTGHYEANGAYLSKPTAAPVLGYTTVINVTVCEIPVINCPADQAFPIEITSTICPDPHANMTPGVCFGAANATHFVPLKSLDPPTVEILQPPAGHPAAAAPATGVHDTLTGGHNATGTAMAHTIPPHGAGRGGLGAMLAVVPSSNHSQNASAPAAGRLTPALTPISAAMRINTTRSLRAAVTVSAGQRVLDARCSLCSVGFAVIATVFCAHAVAW